MKKFLELVFYAFLVSILIFNTSLAASPWLFMYLPLVMFAAMVLDQREAISLGVISLAFYFLFIQNQVHGWLVIPALVEPVTSLHSGLKFQMLGMLSAMVLVSVAVTYLKRRIDFQGHRLKDIQNTLQAEQVQEEALINGLQQGVLLFNSKYKLIRFNNLAADLIGLSDTEKFEKNLFQKVPELVEQLKQRTSEFVLELDGKSSDPKSQIAKSKKLKCRVLEFQYTNEKRFLVIISDETELSQVRDQLELQNSMARMLAEESAKQTGRGQKICGNFDQKFVGNSKAMQAVFEKIRKVAATNTNVLINGESGTGKELVAKAVHKCSEYADNPFVAVNCGAIPENLMESQLFGHKKGAFTGASYDHKGYFQQAEGGTIFLDEIGELPLHLQSKLLRAIQEKRIRPIGFEKDIEINCRIVSATNKDLQDEVKKGQFREDLYYRLNVINLELPPLRERLNDLPDLIDVILRKLNKTNSLPVVPPETLSILMNYSYPGNIRELENIIEHALVLGGEIILPENLPEHLSKNHLVETQILESDDLKIVPNFSLDQHIEEVEKKYIQAALEESDGKKTRAAELLGLNFRSFRYRLQKFQIEG